MKRLLALLLAADFCRPAHAVTLKSEKLYQDSLSAMSRGDYQKAMEGFMDVLLEDPIYPEARDKLAESAKHILSREASAVDRERKQILATLTYKSTQRRSFYRNDVAVRTWRAFMVKAERLAVKPGNLSAVLEAYLKAMGHFQIYHDSKPEFYEAKTRLQTALLQAFPHLARDPSWKDRKAGFFSTGEFAEAVYLEERHGKSWSKDKQGLMYFSDRQQTDVHSQTAAAVKQMESKILGSLSVAIQAHYRYNKGQLADSLILWKRLQGLDPENEEAAFFLDHVAAELKNSEELEPPPVASIDEEEPAAPVQSKRIISKPVTKPKYLVRKPLSTARVDQPPLEKLIEKRTTPESIAEPVLPKAMAQEPAADVALAQEHYLKGLRAYSLGDLKASIRHWKACLELNPDHPKARKALDRALMEDK